MADEQKLPMLHVYPSESSHEEAWVAGTKEGLIALRDALTRAIDSNEPAAVTEYIADGEGYRVLILPLPEKQMDELQLPYYEGSLAWRRGHHKHPYQAIDKKTYVALMREERD